MEDLRCERMADLRLRWRLRPTLRHLVRCACKITFVLGDDLMTNNELIELFAEALEIEASSIQSEKAIADYVEWNSLAWLTIMALLDERYGIQLAAKDFRSFVTVKDAMENITAKAHVV
jgi:acyl carrier protein